MTATAPNLPEKLTVKNESIIQPAPGLPGFERIEHVAFLSAAEFAPRHPLPAVA